MNSHIPLVRKLLLGSVLAGLVLAAGVPAAWAGFPPTRLSAIPGLKPPQFAVAVAIDTFCPRLQTLTLLNRGQADLAARCNELEQQVNFNAFDSSFPNPLGLSNAGLKDVLGKLSQAQEGAKGNTAVETAPHQFRVVAGRLASLRRGGPSISLNDFKLDVDGKTISAAQLFRLNEKGGGASPDANGSSRFGAFLNGNGSFGTRDPTDREVGFDFHTGGVTAGVDYRFTDNLILGVAFNYLRTDADMDRSLGNLATRGYGGLLYGTYYLGAFYVDASGGFTWNNYDTDRNIVYPTVDRTATGSTDGQQYTANVGVGYDFALAGFTITPFGRMEYKNLATESFTESGALGWDLMIRGQRVQSLRSALGLQVGHAFSVPFGVLVPQVRGEWLHEYKNGSRSITASFVNDPFQTTFFVPTDDPTRNFASLAAGISGVFAKGFSAFVNFETFLGLNHVTNHQFTGGVRLEF